MKNVRRICIWYMIAFAALMAVLNFGNILVVAYFGESGQEPSLWLGKVLTGNILLIAAAALLLGVRLYRVMSPIGDGIECLSRREPVRLKEGGPAEELSRKLNETSELLISQDQRLKTKDQTRTEWIAGVSHDVRTPLSLIMGLSDDLAKVPGLAPGDVKKAETICRQSRIIKNLIADLNLTVKLEYQSHPLRLERLSPGMLLRESVAQIYNQGIGEEYQIIPETSREAEQIRISADRQLLLRAFRNLIGNSIRHNPMGCLVKIRSYVEEERLMILFSDSGPGIPGEVADILEGKKENLPEVHIMGLRVVTQIIRAHKGEVRFPRREENQNADVLIQLR